jgi:transcriptional regulator with GAF, ATPase, and Fis domain
MADPSLWYQLHGRDDDADGAALLGELRRGGIAVRERRPGERGTGMILWTGASPDLPMLVRDCSRGGGERVLLVHLGGAPSGGAPSGETSAWEMLRAGAVDLLHCTDARATAQAVRGRILRWAEVDRLVASPLVQRNLIGASPAWRSTVCGVVEAARYADVPVLLLGESGTGKELLARVIHSLDPRHPKRDLVVLDCTTIMPELSGSEFFGHERGSYTGAVDARDGAFARANGGTLFLDEVGELPLRLQAQLLRVIQERTYKRVGADSWQRTDFRLVAATNRNLPELVANGDFRADLYYRLASVSFHVPPLRERPEDILALFAHFFGELRGDVDVPELDPDVKQLLLRRAYPGNVRDLRQLTARIAYRYTGTGPITVGDVPEAERPRGDESPADWRDGVLESCIHRALLEGAGLRDISRSATELAIRIAVDNAGGNIRRAARALGLTDRALHLRRASNGRAGSHVRRRTPRA